MLTSKQEKLQRNMSEDEKEIDLESSDDVSTSKNIDWFKSMNLWLI